VQTGGLAAEPRWLVLSDPNGLSTPNSYVVVLRGKWVLIEVVLVLFSSPRRSCFCPIGARVEDMSALLHIRTHICTGEDTFSGSYSGCTMSANSGHEDIPAPYQLLRCSITTQVSSKIDASLPQGEDARPGNRLGYRRRLIPIRHREELNVPLLERSHAPLQASQARQGGGDSTRAYGRAAIS
jgi:hypothetical protein